MDLKLMLPGTTSESTSQNESPKKTLPRPLSPDTLWTLTQGHCHGCHLKRDVALIGPPLGQNGFCSLCINTSVAADPQPEAGALTKPGSYASILGAKEAGRISTWHFQLLNVCVGSEEFSAVIGNVFSC